jgi:hypothetical protein
MAVRSAGRRLQLQVRDCKRAQPSVAFEATARCVACRWQQGRKGCVPKVAMGHDAALLISVPQQRQWAGGGRMSPMAAKYASAHRTVAEE